MESKELRLRNLVAYKSKIYAIDGISNDYPFLDTIEFGACVIEWKDIEPITLTEEWLLKFGFKKTNSYWFKPNEWENWGMKINQLDGSWIVSHGFGIQFSELNSIRYVHQLQNLYFALTGKELEL